MSMLQDGLTAESAGVLSASGLGRGHSLRMMEGRGAVFKPQVPYKVQSTYSSLECHHGRR